MLIPVQASRSEILEALERVLASPLFRSSERLRQILRFTVETAAEGRAGELKEAVIAVEVFGRDGSFDPKLDAIVRVNMGKLRARLAEYYLGEGAADPVRIEYARGGYVPAFTRVGEPAVEEPAPVAAQGRRWGWVAAAVVVALVGVGIWVYRPAKVEAAMPGSIAVLPFTDLSERKDHETFCDGLSEEIIDQISRVGEMRVVGRTSSFEFKGRAGDLREIGQRLGVGHILEGTVRQAGERIRITAHLNEVATGYRVWSQSWDRTAEAGFSLQDEIARAIAGRLQASRPAEAPTRERLEARALYLRGRHFFNLGQYERARALQEQAVAADPGYAQARAGLARTYVALALDGRPELREMALREAGRALELDAASPEAYAARVHAAHYLDGDWDGARKACEEGRPFGENDAQFKRSCGLLYSMLGEVERAVSEAHEAAMLEPAVSAYSWAHAFVLFRAGRFEEAVQQTDHALELRPDYLPSYLVKALALAYLGRGEEAMGALEAGRAFAEQDRREYETVRAVVLARMGRGAEAVKILEQARIPDFLQARVYLAMADAERGFGLLEKAAARGEREAIYVLADPGAVAQGANPRYRELRRRFGLPEAAAQIKGPGV